MTDADSAKIAVICFTARGEKTAQRIGSFYGADRCSVWCKRSAREPLPDTDGTGTAAGASAGAGSIRTWKGTLGQWTEAYFHVCDVLVYVGATGIAVRAIAPYLESKTTDPAVLCVDEGASYVIPLVSGHIGGANEYAAALAGALHAAAVVTTATDINGRFAVDVFARRNALLLSDMKLAKRISAEILEGKTVGFASEFPVRGSGGGSALPEGLSEPERATGGLQIYVGIHRKTYPDAETLYLVPKIVTAGAGCRRDTDPAEMLRFFQEVLFRENIVPEAVEAVCSIDVKKDEKALLGLARMYGIPFRTFDAQALSAVPGTFSSSEFVRKTVGVDNVCERSALLGSMPGRLVCPKQAQSGMTLALAVREWRCCFE